MNIIFCVILGLVGWIIVVGMITIMNRIYVFTQRLPKLPTLDLIRFYLQYDCYKHRAERSPH